MSQVSRKIEGGIQSEYLSMHYRPSEDKSNNELNRKCGDLTLHMAIADITRKNEHIDNIIQDFCEAFLMCKNEEEIKNFKTFMNKLSDLGGIATVFNSEASEIITQNDKKTAEEILNQVKERKEKNNKIKSQSKENNLNVINEFKRIYMNLNNEYNKFISKPMISDREIELLIEMYQKLYDNLMRIKDSIDKEEFDIYQKNINNNINKLKDMYNILGQLNRPLNNYSNRR